MISDIQWRPVKGYEDSYLISNLGDVRSLISHRTLKTSLVRNYRRVPLYKNKQLKFFLVHRLVAIAFISDPPFQNAEVMHLNNDPANNSLDNLKWGTHAVNMEMDRGNNHSHKGEENGNRKISEDDVLQIRTAFESKTNQRWGRNVFAKRLGISKTHVLRIAQKKGWNHV